MSTQQRILMEIPYSLRGVKCFIAVTHFHRSAGNPYSLDPVDYKGRVEMSWHLKDLYGYPALELEGELTDADCDSIEALVDETAGDDFTDTTE